MKVFIDGTELADAVSKVGKAMPLKKSLSILEGIKLKAENDILTLTATDLELSIETKIQANVQLDGDCVINGKFFIDYINKIKDYAIELDNTAEESLIIRYNDGMGTMLTMPIEEYPPFKNVDEITTFNISQKEFKELINKVIFCAAQEDNRPALKGCCLEIENNTITAVTSDGYRMALCKKSVEYSAESHKVIVPARSLNEISKLLDDGDEQIKINIEKNHLMVQKDQTKIVTRLIDAEYINYNKIIPVDFTTELTIDKKMLERSLDRASLITKADKKNIVKLDIKENVMNISAQSEESGNNENINVSLTGKDLLIGFNTRYLIESLRAISDNFVKMKFNSSTAPGIIVPTDSDEFLYLILPIRIIS